MKQYLELLDDIMTNGTEKSDRTGTGTVSVFGRQLRFDLQEGFPLLTTKKVHFKSIVHELLWFIKGDRNVKYLNDNGVNIWNEWANEDGDIGPMYGVQWRSWPSIEGDSIDQLGNIIWAIKHNPDSRRMIVSAWNVDYLEDMALAPCHVMFQFYVADNKLSCQVYQRSADIFLGLPFNIASYALLTMMVAQVTGLKPGELIHTIGDAHIYQNHMRQVYVQRNRVPLNLPQVALNPRIDNIDDFKFDDISLLGYQSYPAIKAPVAV